MLGTISYDGNGHPTTDIPRLTFKQVNQEDTTPMFYPSADGNPWYDTARNRIFWNCVTDRAFVKYNHQKYQLAQNSLTDLSGITTSTGEFLFDLESGQITVRGGFDNSHVSGKIPIGHWRRQKDGTFNFYDLPIFQLGYPAISVREVGITGGTIAVGHRGYNRIAPEQTADAYLLSRSYGSTVWEADILFTSDGIPVCHHDETINRVARNKDGSRIASTIRLEDCTFAQLKKYDWGIYKNEYFAGTKILTFENWVKMANIFGVEKLFIELKNGTPRAWILKMIEILKSWNMYDKAYWLAFDWTNFDTIASVDDRTGFIMLNGRTSKISEMKQYMNGVREVWASPHHSISVEEAKQLKEAGFKLYLWTLKTTEEVTKFKDVFIDGFGYDGDINIANVQRRQIMQDSI